MQAQYPPQQSLQQQYKVPTPATSELNHPFAHLLHLPVFQIFDLKELEVIRQTIERHRQSALKRQEIRNDLPPPPPPPSTADAITAKVVMEYLSMMSDGGTTLVVSQFKMDKMLRGAVNMMDAMDEFSAKQDMTPSATIVYSRWASPRDMPGPTIIVDCLGWFKISDRSRFQGIQVKANTTAKIKVNAEKWFSVKEGKEWKKTWFRGREDVLTILVTRDDGTQMKLEKVVSFERELIPAIYGDFFGRWKEFSVPRLSS